jgi:hypothetical protein
MKFDLLRGHARAWRICGDAPPPLGRSSPCRNRGPERGARFLRSRLRQPNPRPRDPGCPSGKPLGWRVPSLKWHAPSATAPRYLPSRRDYVVKCARKRAAGPAPARRPLVAIGRVGRGCRDFQGSLRYSHAGVAEWQTRRTQNPLAARPCGFDSLLRHRNCLATGSPRRDECPSPCETRSFRAAQQRRPFRPSIPACLDLRPSARSPRLRQPSP